MITLSERSLTRLGGVHPDLVRVVKRAAEISDIDFMVIEGQRSVERQKQLVAEGKSKTMTSRHIPKAVRGYAGLMGHAVDLGVLVNGNVVWNDGVYKQLADIVKKAAALENVPIEWGGDWRTFHDGPHFQLPWSKYP